jgi:hypothetical protein
VNVAARHRITDAVEQEQASGIGNDLLCASAYQGVVVDLAAVP